MVTNVADILETIGLTTVNSYHTAASKSEVRPLPPLSKQAQHLYSAIPNNGVSMDQLGEQLGLNASDLAMTVTELELEGLVRREGSLISQANYY